MDFEILLGRTLKSINVDRENNEITFIDTEDLVYQMYHDQSCCESVIIDDIVGDVSDLIDSPITMAEKITNRKDAMGKRDEYGAVSFTWTFYKLATIKGYVTIKWWGESNGYYSEDVWFGKVNIKPKYLKF